MRFRVGDRVVADRAIFDTFTETFVIYAIDYSITGRRLFRVRAVGEPRSVGTVFYADELSFEDGSRP